MHTPLWSHFCSPSRGKYLKLHWCYNWFILFRIPVVSFGSTFLVGWIISSETSALNVVFACHPCFSPFCLMTHFRSPWLWTTIGKGTPSTRADKSSACKAISPAYRNPHLRHASSDLKREGRSAGLQADAIRSYQAKATPPPYKRLHATCETLVPKANVP